MGRWKTKPNMRKEWEVKITTKKKLEGAGLLVVSFVLGIIEEKTNLYTCGMFSVMSGLAGIMMIFMGMYWEWENERF
jgi:hypothetical protein